jgi:hypothetical protein
MEPACSTMLIVCKKINHTGLKKPRTCTKSIAMAYELSRKANQKKNNGSKNYIKRGWNEIDGILNQRCKKGFESVDGKICNRKILDG